MKKQIIKKKGQDLFEELEQILLFHEKPSEKLQKMSCSGVLNPLGELLSLAGVPQNPIWHPEGDVWVHTMMVIDEAVLQRQADPYWDRCLMWSALCHDLGKPLCTFFEEGRWRSPHHEHIGVQPTLQMLRRLNQDSSFIEDVCRLVEEHLVPHFFAEQKTSTLGIRRLLQRLGKIPLDILVRLGRADSFGRTTEQARKREYPSGEWLLEKAEGLSAIQLEERPEPLVLGRHLLPLGMKPGKELGVLLSRIYEAQLAGRFFTQDEGILWAKKEGLFPIV